MSTARHCKNCGKKYYPKSYYSYPQFRWGTSDEDKLDFARFHSLGCMQEWLDKNKQAFAFFVEVGASSSRDCFLAYAASIKEENIG